LKQTSTKSTRGESRGKRWRGGGSINYCRQKNQGANPNWTKETLRPKVQHYASGIQAIYTGAAVTNNSPPRSIPKSVVEVRSHHRMRSVQADNAVC